MKRSLWESNKSGKKKSRSWNRSKRSLSTKQTTKAAPATETMTMMMRHPMRISSNLTSTSSPIWILINRHNRSKIAINLTISWIKILSCQKIWIIKSATTLKKQLCIASLSSEIWSNSKPAEAKIKWI